MVRQHTKYLPTKFTLKTLLIALTTCVIAFGLINWARAFLPVLPLGVAIPLFWFGAACVSVGSNRFTGHSILVFIGSGLVGMAILIAIGGTILFVLAWLLAPTY